MKGKIHVRIENGLVAGDVSVPTDAIPGGKGRYFNGSATFDVSMDEGVLIVTLADADVNGQPVPAQVLEAMARENLAKDMYKDPEVAKALKRIDSVEVADDLIILKVKHDDADQPEGDVEEDAGADDPSSDDGQAGGDGEPETTAESADGDDPDGSVEIAVPESQLETAAP